MCFRKEIFSGTSFRDSDKSGEEALFFKKLANTCRTIEYEDTIICLKGIMKIQYQKDRFFNENQKINNLSNYGLDTELLEILKKNKKKYL